MPLCIVHGLSYCGSHWILTVGDILEMWLDTRGHDTAFVLKDALSQRGVSVDLFKSAGGAVLPLRIICHLLVDHNA